MNNDISIHPVDKASALSNFFSSISTSSLNFQDFQDLPPLGNHDFSSINITSQDVLDQLHVMSINKPAGLDMLAPHILKGLSSSLATTL